VVEFLEKRGIDVDVARKHYDAGRAEESNRVSTNFTGLRGDELDALELHALWQVYACRAAYGPIIGLQQQPRAIT
jgi:hypothetical protein